MIIYVSFSKTQKLVLQNVFPKTKNLVNSFQNRGLQFTLERRILQLYTLIFSEFTLSLKRTLKQPQFCDTSKLLQNLLRSGYNFQSANQTKNYIEF